MADESGEEIARLRARLEALEKAQAAPPRPANPYSHLPSYHQPKGPRSGGLPRWARFGLVACGIGFAALVVVAVATAPPRSAATAATIDPSNYTGLCAAALTRVQFATHQLVGAELTPNDATVIQTGPPLRLQCGIAIDTYIGAVTFDALCDDWQRDSCVNVTAAVMDGRVVYVSPEASAAIAAAAKGHRQPSRS